jgi:hypothetical protein
MVQQPQAMTADVVRAELARIVASPHFDASERNRAFLAFVVEEALAERPTTAAGEGRTGAAAALAEIRAIDPGYGAHAAADLACRHVAPALIPPILAGLAKAGLAVPAVAPDRAAV